MNCDNENILLHSQRDNEVLTSRGSPNIKLHQPSLPSSVQTESVVLSPPPSPSLEELADITVCENFSVSPEILISFTDTLSLKLLMRIACGF